MADVNKNPYADPSQLQLGSDQTAQLQARKAAMPTTGDFAPGSRWGRMGELSANSTGGGTPSSLSMDKSQQPILTVSGTNAAPTGGSGAPPAAPAPAKEMSPGEAASAGLGWVPSNHPLYGTPGFVGSQAAGATPPTAAPTPPPPTTTPPPPAGAAPTGSGPGTDIQKQASNASTFSQTPGAAPVANTANQGGQDVFRNALISQMSQTEAPTVNDPTIQAQLQPYAAAQERARADEVRRGAEEAFAGNQDYGVNERMAASERAGQNTGLMAGDLVGRELTARRQQISDALSKFGDTLSGDQQRALQEKLTSIDNAIRQQGLAQSGQLGNRELDIRDKLGMGGLNVDLLRTQNQNTQFGQDLGFRIGDAQARYNNAALQQAMGG